MESAVDMRYRGVVRTSLALLQARLQAEAAALAVAEEAGREGSGGGEGVEGGGAKSEKTSSKYIRAAKVGGAAVVGGPLIGITGQ